MSTLRAIAYPDRETAERVGDGLVQASHRAPQSTRRDTTACASQQ